jgi:hypothetical protein
MNENNSFIDSLLEEDLTLHRGGQWFKSSTAHQETLSKPQESTNELSLIRGLLLQLLGPEGRRRLVLRNLPNAELTRLYDSELVFSFIMQRTYETPGTRYQAL